MIIGRTKTVMIQMIAGQMIFEWLVLVKDILYVTFFEAQRR